MQLSPGNPWKSRESLNKASSGHDHADNGGVSEVKSGHWNMRPTKYAPEVDALSYGTGTCGPQSTHLRWMLCRTALEHADGLSLRTPT